MKYIFSILLFLSVNVLYSQSRFTINGTTPELLNHKKVVLLIQDYYSLNRFNRLDSAVIENNKFSFSGSIYKPCEIAQITLKDKTLTGGFNFVIDTGLNSMEIHPIDSTAYDIQNTLSDTRIINSATNILSRKIMDLRTKYYKLYGKKQWAEPGHIAIKVLDLHTETELNIQQIEVVKQNPHSFYSLIFIYSKLYSRLPLDTILNAYNSLDPDIKSTPVGLELYKVASELSNAKKSSQHGNQVPEFVIKTSQGKLFNNKTLIGKPYVIAFSATWCIPCRYYEKKLKSLYAKYHSKGLEVVYFNLDDNVSKWKEHIKRDKLNWINVSECTKWANSKIAPKFYVQGIPLYIVVDKKGSIIYNRDEIKDSDYNDLEKYVQKAISN
jgi:thiol-disulfide isomerase/thioredoxin